MSILDAKTYHQLQLLSKFSKIQIFDPTCGTTFRLPYKFICSDFLIRGPPEPIRVAKNTGTRNEFTDCEKFEVEHPNRITSMAALRPQVPLRRGITLQARRSTSHMRNEAQRRKAMKFAPARTREHFRGRNLSAASNLKQIFENQKIFEPTCGTAFRLPCKFICSDVLMRGSI